MITNKEIQPGVYDGKLTLETLNNCKESQALDEYEILESNDGMADSQIYDGSCAD